MKFGRRDFIVRSAGLATTAGGWGRIPANASGDRVATEEYRARWYEFSKHPTSNTCWAVTAGPDGRVYASACDGSPGGVVKVVRYDERHDALEYLFSVDKIVDDSPESGRAPQCKIHYGFAPSLSDGILYMATHLSSPPIDQPVYSPWLSWHDERRCFRGSAVLAFDTARDQVLWWDTLIPKEGCRCLLHDEERRLLYAITYPRDHLMVYDLASRRRRDLGRIGSVNSQALFIDKKHRVWTTSDYGRLVRYSPDKDRLEESPFQLPHHPQYQSGWHSVFYDVAPSPDRECVYAVTWVASPYLVRIWPNEGEWPRVENLGLVTQPRDLSLPEDTFRDHCGGLTFAGDGQLYYVASRWRDPVYNNLPPGHQDLEGVVWRLNPATLERQETVRLDGPSSSAQYVSRGAVDHNGDLFFGHVGSVPAGIFKLTLPNSRRKKDAHLPLRMWG